MDIYFFLFVYTASGIFLATNGMEQRLRGARMISTCQSGSCYPITGNLLIGREKNLSTNSTCGLPKGENYCIVSNLHKNNLNGDCFSCDSRQPYSSSNKFSHRIENIVSPTTANSTVSWWQAHPGENNVYIQLDLESEFHFTHLVITFKTFRPAAMLVERSYDFGKTWKVYRYFAHECEKSFPGIPTVVTGDLSQVICESRYTKPLPSKNGEVVLRVLPAISQIADPYSEEVQNLLKITNLRINFTKLHTLGDDLLRESANHKYYYAIYNMIVRGSCSCYGHAFKCKPLPGQRENLYMVYGQCECNHHTAGHNCEKCEDFYNDLPWRPGHGKEKNECKKCNCNNHSTKCHFDPAVYMANNRQSGGVCDDCQHNTMGQHCEECKPHFYLNPEANIEDQNACLACDCDPAGTEHDGECDGKTDQFLDLIAGRCACKRFVTGRRCDTCITGFWNLRKDNVDGCEACACHSVGTVPGYECEGYSGECKCKRFVTGRTCDQCMPGYWGLGTDMQGCQACNCNAGGSYDAQCDERTGYCRCRPNIVGRHCNQLAIDHFYPLPDWLIYEAEYATGSGKHEVINRERIPGQTITWTGPGFMKVFEKSSLEFVVDNIPYSMEYGIVIRYESQLARKWEDVKVTIERSGTVDQGGACANVIPNDYHKTVTLDSRSNFVLLQPDLCFERGIRYVIQLEFPKYRHKHQDPHMLIDSLVILPGMSGHPMVLPNDPNNMYNLFTKYKCRNSFYSSEHSEVADICRGLIFSSSVALHDGAKACDCDPYGSLSSTCNKEGGQCQCKEGFYGRRCHQCLPGYYGFSGSGCKSCSCHNYGSSNRFCDPHTGQCTCNANSYGLRCDSCQRGYWGFPDCRKCQCNGRADECDNESGACLNCRDGSGGPTCERCADGFYGDFRTGCHSCACPGTQGVQHADSCTLDPRSNQMTCHCRHGYTGPNCGRCADNYYGNPTVPGGRCEHCTCNNNIDMGIPGSCDSRTGECLKCLYNTDGRSCERCIRGYYGDALRQSCRPCVCNGLGTQQDSLDSCDPITGQCKCLPHVTGRECDQCEPNYWKLADGRGCEPCNCDPYGSLSQQCNEFDGQCRCRDDYGGRDCSGCADNYWNDRRTRCQPCRCNPYGSLNQQCDKRTGACQCRPGVTGHECEMCARGSTGSMPNCQPCGLCYDGWEKIITEVSVDLQTLVEQGRNIKHTGTTGEYEREFREMEIMLEEVRRILMGIDHGSQSVDWSSLIRMLQEMQPSLDEYRRIISTLDHDDSMTTNRVRDVISRIERIRQRVNELKIFTYELKSNATKIQEQDVSGAFNSIRESYEKSNSAYRKVVHSTHILQRSEQTRTYADQILESKKSDIDKYSNQNHITIREFQIQVEEVNKDIVDFNDMVCYGRGNPCHPICGGAGCGRCGGGLTCQEGSVSKAQHALNISIRAEELFREKAEQARKIVSQAEYQMQQCQSTRLTVERAHNTVWSLRNVSQKSITDVQELVRSITFFLRDIINSPNDVRQICELVLSIKVTLTPSEIERITVQITRLVSNLTNIDSILRETRNILEEARLLKIQADNAKDSAEGVRSTTHTITQVLSEASSSQYEAEETIRRLRENIRIAEENLKKIDANISETGLKSNFSKTTVFNVKGRVDKLNTQYQTNRINAENAFELSQKASAKVEEIVENMDDLDQQFNRVLGLIKVKEDSITANSDRAALLRRKAQTLYQTLSDSRVFVQEWNKKFAVRENTLTTINVQIMGYFEEMNQLITSIREKETYHRTCGTA